MSDSSISLQFKPSSFSDDLKEPWPSNYVNWLIPSMDEVERLASELRMIINEANDERPVQNFFERNPGLLVQLAQGGHGRWLFPKPRFGSEHVPDFMICEKDSAGYHWLLVELENPNYDALTKKGNPTAKFTHAMQQIDDWRIWLRKHSLYAQSELGYLGLDNEFRAIIVLGRRIDRNAKDQERYRELSLSKGELEVMSYDRLFDRVVFLAKGLRNFWDKWSAEGK